MNPKITIEKYTDIKNQEIDIWKSSELNKTYINEMVDKEKNKKYIMFYNPIIMVKFKTEYYIVKGQHRKAIMRQLYKKHKIDSTTNVMCYDCKNIKDVNNIYDEYHQITNIIIQLNRKIDMLTLSSETINNQLVRANNIIKNKNITELEHQENKLQLKPNQMQCQTCGKIFAKNYKEKHETTPYHKNHSILIKNG